MDSIPVGFDKICRFCGYEKSIGKFIFSNEAVKIGLLSKIKQLFPEEVELINSEVILPKFICNACETTINYFFEFYNTVKLVQENLRKRIQPEELPPHTHCGNILYKPQHLCQELVDQAIITVSFNSNGIITCNNCSMKLDVEQVRCLSECLSYCICNDCGYKDETHFFLNKKNSNLTCPRCVYMNKKRMNDENISNKIKEKKFKCDICLKVFRSKGHLNRHRLTHYGAKPYLCENCGTGFNQRSSLKTHTLIHKKVNPFSCKWCGQQFRHKQTLLNHVMSIHGYIAEAGNLYECDKCKKKFINKAKLRRHYRSHSGEKPFQCNICDKSFTQNINLKTHYKKHETENAFSNISMYPTQTVLNEAEQGKIIQELFTDCEHLNIHLDNLGTDGDDAYDPKLHDSFVGDQNLNLDPQVSADGTYFDISSSSTYLMYPDTSNLYGTDDVSKTSMLPTFSTLSAVP